MVDKKPPLKLYYGYSCPFCQKVLRYLEANQIDIGMVDVWENDDALGELLALAGKKQVPCLRVDGIAMHESDAIIAFLDKQYNH